MPDVFISYSRTDKDRVAKLAEAIEREGYDVWWDAELPPHQSYGDVITAKIEKAKAAVVVWSKEAAASEWVRAEADAARNQKKLIQTSLGNIIPPLPFNQIQCADLTEWDGVSDHPSWNKVKQSLVALAGERTPAAPVVEEPPVAAPPPPPPPPPPAPPPPPEPAPEPAPEVVTAPLKTGPIGATPASPPPSSPPPPQPQGLMGAAPEEKPSNKPQLILAGVAGGIVLLVMIFALIGISGSDDEDDYEAAALVDNPPMDDGGTPPIPQPVPPQANNGTPPAAQAAPTGDGYNRDVSLINSSGETIVDLYWSSTDDQYWGEDRMGNDVFPAGNNWFVTVDDGSGSCAFDFMAITESGYEIVRPNVNVCSVYQINFN